MHALVSRPDGRESTARDGSCGRPDLGTLLNVVCLGGAAMDGPGSSVRGVGGVTRVVNACREPYEVPQNCLTACDPTDHRQANSKELTHKTVCHLSALQIPENPDVD